MRLWKQALVSAAFVAASFLPAAQALAQDATPVTIPLATAPAYCSGEPANLARLREIAGSAADNPDTTVLFEMVPTAGSTPADPADATAVTDLVNTFVACVNANDGLRAAALLTDDFIIRTAYAIIGDLEDNGAPQALDAEDQSRIAGATPVVQLPDGRFALTVDIGPVTGESPFARIQFVVINNDGVWLVDDFRFADLDTSDIGDDPDCGDAETDGCVAPPCGDSSAPGCTDPGGATPVIDTSVVPAKAVEGEGYTGWLMNAAQAEIAMPMFNITDERYMPKDAQAGWVSEAEAALPAYLATQPNATPRLIADINSRVFERQYFVYGYEFQYLLVINGYCPDSYLDPSVTPVMVLDGGDCFWQATYDIRTHTFVSLSVNGNA